MLSLILKISGSCTDPGLASMLYVVKKFINILWIIGPILAIIGAVIAFIKLLSDPEEKKYKSLFKNMITALLLLFFLPAIINVCMQLFDGQFDLATCWNQAEIIHGVSGQQSHYIDPNNPNKIYDPTSGVSVSTVNVGMLKPEITNATETDGVKFIYQGESGQQVRLGGTFTNWDSWIYELKETKPGFYELVLPLPEGTYYYNYYLGMNSIIDKTNPKKAYTSDGRTTSVIEVPSKG